MKRSSSRSSKAPQSEIDIEINNLRIQQKDAIENLDYDTAEELSKKIKQLKKNASMLNCDHQMEVLEAEIYKTLQATDNELNTMYENIRKEEKKIRERIHRKFEKLDHDNVNQLIDLERQYAQARLLETQRTIPEKEELLVKSRYAARNEDFEAAREYRNKAELIAQIDLEQRLQKTDIDYDQARRIQLAKQREGFETLSKQLEGNLKNLQGLLDLKEKKIFEDRDTRLRGLLQKSRFTTGDANSINIINLKLERFMAEVLTKNGVPLPKGIGEQYTTKLISNASQIHSK